MKDKILLALLLPYLAIGAVVCHEVDGKMVCSGTGQLEADIGGEYLIITNLVVTNVLGVCTNCVQMSPSTCETIKFTFNNKLDEIDYNLRSTIPDALQSILTDANNANNYLNTIIANHNVPDSEELSMLRSFFRWTIPEDVSNVQSKIDSINAPLSAVHSAVGNINCIECESFSPSVVTNNNTIIITNSGSSVSGNWATYDQMVALHKSVSDIQIFVQNIKGQIEKQHATISNFWQETHRDLQGISNIVHRLDDYARGDFSNSIYHININVGEIVKAITNLNRNLFIDQQYSNATYYVDLNNQPSPMVDLRSRLLRVNQSFDYGEFGNLSWFQRVEFLLLEISGLNNLTNALKDDEQLNNEARENFKSTKNLLESISSQGSELESSISSLGDSVKRFAGSLQFSVDGSGQLVLVPNFWSKMPGNVGNGRSTADLVMPVDSRLREFLRVLSSLFWTAISLVILYRMTIFWIHFFWDSWDRFMKTALESVT